MKKLVYLLLLLSFYGHASEVTPQIEEVRLLPQEVYIPSGFDDNDVTQIVIDGLFPETCYSVGVSDFDIDLDRRRIYIENIARRLPEDGCKNSPVYYQKTIELGFLEEGNYKVFFKDEGDQAHYRGRLNISPSRTSDSDDFLYAPVSNIRVFEKGAKTFAEISGHFEDTCFRLYRTEVILNQNVVEILPFVDYMNFDDCEYAGIPFKDTIEIKGRLKKSMLFHVRVLNGQSLNYIHRFR